MKRELAVLARLIRRGTLELELPGGARHRFGSDQPSARWSMAQADSLRRIVANPELALGETYMRGEWGTAPGELATLLAVLMRNADELSHAAGWLRRMLGGLLQQWNRVQASYRNVAHHYDLDEWLFRRFLDREMYYSCAYFAVPGLSLEAAQRAKAEHIAAKLRLQPGQRVLDIGCGWGSLALHLAQHHDVHVTGLTLSRPQLAVAQRTAQERGLSGRVQFLLQDYREHDGPVRPHRQRRHVRARRAAVLRDASSGRWRPACARAAWRCCTPSVAWARPASPTPGCANTSFRAATTRPCRN